MKVPHRAAPAAAAAFWSGIHKFSHRLARLDLWMGTRWAFGPATAAVERGRGLGPFLSLDEVVLSDQNTGASSSRMRTSGSIPRAGERWCRPRGGCAAERRRRSATGEAGVAARRCQGEEVQRAFCVHSWSFVAAG